MRIFFSAGEASGDMYGAYLLREMKKMQSKIPVRVEAIGGPQLKEAGAHLVADSSQWGAIGYYEAFRVLPRVYRSYMRARRALTLGEPGLFIPIDFGYVNVKLATLARDLGWKVLYFIPPGSWKRTTQGEGLPAITDEIVTPFSWSAGYLSSIGAKVHWYGHPLKQIVYDDPRPFEHEESTSIGILPGSRIHEVKHNMKYIARACEKVTKLFTLEFAVSRNIGRERMAKLWRQAYKGDRHVIFTERDTLGVLKRSRAAIICSGTATLEGALCRCPMVVIYRFSKIAEMQARIFRIRPKFIALPNIVLDRTAVVELLQYDATPKRIAIELLQLLDGGVERQSQLDAFERIDEELGGNDAITRTASLALKTLVSG